MLAAAVFGGVIVLSGAYGLHVGGVLKLQPDQPQGISTELSSALERIAKVEQDLGGLADSSAASDAAARLDALDARIAELGDAAGNAGATALSEDVKELKTSYQMLAAKFGSLANGAGASGSEGLASLEQRVAAAEDALGKAQGLENTFGALSSEVSEFATRLENVEATAKAAQTAVSTSDVSLKTLADSQARASETLASLSADIRSATEMQSSDLAKVREQLETLSARLAAVEATMGDATAREVAARALSVSALKSAVDSGRPYETELAAVRAGLPKDTDLSALEAHATTGVAPVSVLIAEFPAKARAMFAEFTQPERTGDMLESLLAGAKSIIAVRGPGDDSGDGPEAVLRRAENAVGRGDLAAALEAFDKLPEDAKAVGADWAERARARVEIDRLTDKASSEVLSALSRRDS
ncbi:COG4223 family protein [Roseibium sp.]|uniref:COG4223 family protein n=1 Tax=Roseibium sp. TaxID=1936156 RepID=UPI003A97956E